MPSNTAYVPPAESIETVNIVTNSFDAEQGGAVGAAVNVVTKSGTNSFHGSLFEFHTNNALKAVERFRPAGFRNSKSILNQYGGSIGGPIRKDKLFFFADWEATKRRQFATRSGTVINPAGVFDSAGNANLSAAIPAGTNCDVTPVAGCVFDPSTGAANGSGRRAFPGNIIPANRIDPAAKTILGRINTASFLNNLGVTANNNYLSAGSAKLDRNTVDTKVNYLPNERFMGSSSGAVQSSRTTTLLHRALGKLLAEVGYVGNHGVRLLTNENINSAPVGGGTPGGSCSPWPTRIGAGVHCTRSRSPSCHR